MSLIGKPAPGFKLQGVDKDGEVKEFKLEDYKGKWVVLFFYPLDFSPVCPTEVKEFSKNIDQFEKLDTVVLGASGGSVFSHKDWLGHIGPVSYPLLCDMTHETIKAYGSLMEEQGFAARSTFIIDPDGNMRFAMYHDPSVGRSIREVYRMLASLQTGDMCPAEWHPGEDTLGKLG